LLLTQHCYTQQIAELEAEFELFLDDNGLDGTAVELTAESLQHQVARLTGELATARLDALRWQKVLSQLTLHKL
jgi:hypothetical protein